MSTSYSLCSGLMSKQNIKSGDPVVAFILINRPNSAYYNVGRSSFVCNEMPSIFFEPCSLPIFGIAGEWATLEEIEKTPHVFAIEDALDMSIEDFIKGIGNHPKPYSFFSICFEHRYVYDAMIEEAKKLRFENKDFMPYQSLMTQLGFKLTHIDLDNQHHLFFKHTDPKLKGIQIRANTYSFEVFENDRKSEQTFYSVKKLAEHLNLDMSLFQEKINLDFLVEEARIYKDEIISLENDETYSKAIKEITNNLKTSRGIMTPEIEAQIADIDIIKKSIMEKNQMNFLYSEDVNSRKAHIVSEVCGNFSKLLYPNSMFDFENKELVDFMLFDDAMYKTNSTWNPTFSCYDDCGERTLLKELHNIVKPTER